MTASKPLKPGAMTPTALQSISTSPRVICFTASVNGGVMYL